jgi:hypothetical protein
MCNKEIKALSTVFNVWQAIVAAYSFEGSN